MTRRRKYLGKSQFDPPEDKTTAQKTAQTTSQAQDSNRLQNRPQPKGEVRIKAVKKQNVPTAAKRPAPIKIGHHSVPESTDGTGDTRDNTKATKNQHSIKRDIKRSVRHGARQDDHTPHDTQADDPAQTAQTPLAASAASLRQPLKRPATSRTSKQKGGLVQTDLTHVSQTARGASTSQITTAQASSTTAPRPATRTPEPPADIPQTAVTVSSASQTSVSTSNTPPNDTPTLPPQSPLASLSTPEPTTSSPPSPQNYVDTRPNGPNRLWRMLNRTRHRLSHVHIWVWLALGATLLVVMTLLTAWFMWPIRTVYVMGNAHLSVPEVRKLAGLSSKFGWWYYGAWRAKGLTKSPWIISSKITREYPDKVILQITERQPFLRWKKSNGEVVLVSKDGQVLPNSADYPQLPVLKGWGPERLNEAMLATLALSRYTVKSVEYTPSGLTVDTAAGTVWSGDLKSLLKYAGSVSMYPKKQMNIYPWGVSVRQ